MEEIISYSVDLRDEFIELNNIKSVGYSDFVNAIGKQTLFNYTLDALLDSEYIKFNGKKIRFKKKVNPCQFAGFFFEYFFANLINNDYIMKDRLFRWTSRIRKEEFWVDYGYDSYEEFLRCLSVVAKGSLKAQVFFPNDYCSACKNDIMFIIKDRENDLEERTLCGLQVKAINGYENREIIKKIRSKKYKNVLTVLQNSDGIHSISRCNSIVNNLVKSGEISFDKGNDIMSKIVSPWHLGISQEYINNLYKYIIYITTEGFKLKDFEFYWLLKVFEKIALAESGQKVITTSA